MSEEVCLVNSKSLTGLSAGGMAYTEGIHSMTSSNNEISQQQQQQNHQQRIGGRPERDSQHSQESDSGDLIDFNDEIILCQFHSNAITQAGFGRFQLYASIIAGLGLAGHAIQVYSVFYILPSAEVEFCILGNEKSWLGNITLVGLGVGALIWGGLAGRNGRLKTLLSCLSVTAVFSVIAAFMPTYGPFMMARFCAAAGIGGALPSATSYLCELTPINNRARILGFLGLLGIAGGVLAGSVAILTLPLTGQMVIVENKEHFSAWHRYLLLITLPTIGSILGLFWLPESPRYLLEVGREVDALAIYQRIYRCNRPNGGYAITELEMPTTRHQEHRAPASVLDGMMLSFKMFCGSYYHLYKKAYLRSTLLLLAVWVLAILVYHGLTIYIATYSKTIEITTYNSETVTKYNITYQNVNFNQSMDNIIFSDCKFINCTFRQMFISHADFINSIFIESEFANVKTSRTKFQKCNFEDVKLIDTDLTERHFIDCKLNNTKIIRLLVNCDKDFEYNIYLEKLWQSNMGALLPSLLVMGLFGECVSRKSYHNISIGYFTSSMVLCILFGFLSRDDYIIWTGGMAQSFILAGLASSTLIAIETYTTPLRCSALGMFMCGGHFGALIGAPLYSALPIASSNVAGCISAILMSITAISSMLLKDPCSLL